MTPTPNSISRKFQSGATFSSRPNMVGADDLSCRDVVMATNESYKALAVQPWRS